MHVTGNLSRGISPARRASFEVLEAVGEGAYASDCLRDRTANLNSRDAGLASQIVLGSLRFQGQLDYLISRYSGRKIENLEVPVRIALQAAIFQIRYLERVPPHAAVHESVEWVKARRPRAAGLTNAVLRKVDRRAVRWPDEATELSCPGWLLDRWRAHFGPKFARGIAAAGLREPVRYVRIPPGEAPVGLQLCATDVAGAFRALSALPPGTRLHDISSQAIVPLLDLKPGSRYLDLCAAPGNKTLQALETPLAMALACDISYRRLSEIPPVCPRIVLDATKPLPFDARFDRIFIDAPCSGTGTLGRNPEIKWRIKEGEFARFREKQIAILSQALRLLAPQGKLVYATCTLEREENEDVVRAVLVDRPQLSLFRELWRVPGRDEGDGFYAAVLALKPGPE